MRKTDYELMMWPVNAPASAVRIEHASISYKINDIPQAMVRLSHGYSFNTGTAASLPNSWRDPRTLFRIGYKAKMVRSFDNREVTADKIIFEGYPRTPSAEISAATGDLTLLMVHWLSDLADSVVRSQFSYPGHVGQKYYDAVTYPDSLSGIDTQPEGIAKAVGLPGDWKYQITSDIWALGAKQIMAVLLTNPVMANLSQSQLCIDAINVPTKAAADALRRIQGPSETLGSPYVKGGGPLPLYRGQDDRAVSVIAEGVVQSIGYRPISNMQSSSAWDMVSDFGAAFALYLIPRPTDAFFAPVVPGINRYYTATILEQDIMQVSWADTRNVNLRGVAVAAHLQDLSGATEAFQLSVNNDEVYAGGCYVASKDPNDGLVAFIRPPVWLTPLHINTADGSVTFQDGDAKGPHNPPGQPEANSRPISIVDYYNQFAKQRFIEEQLRGRSLQVVTPLRTDICVGSTIAVGIRKEQSLQRIGIDTPSLVGTVRELTITLSRVSNQATTSYILDFVRTLEELSDPAASVDKHPVFDSIFVGAELA